MEPKGSLSSSQEPTSQSYTELIQFTLCPHIQFHKYYPTIYAYISQAVTSFQAF